MACSFCCSRPEPCAARPGRFPACSPVQSWEPMQASSYTSYLSQAGCRTPTPGGLRDRLQQAQCWPSSNYGPGANPRIRGELLFQGSGVTRTCPRRRRANRPSWPFAERGRDPGDRQDQSRDCTASRHFTAASLGCFARAQAVLSGGCGSTRQVVWRWRRGLGAHAGGLRYLARGTRRGCERHSHAPSQSRISVGAALATLQ